MTREETRLFTLPDFLTEAQIARAAELYDAHGMGATAAIRAQIIEPNMPAINAKLGQENDASYLAYAVVYVFSQLEGPRERAPEPALSPGSDDDHA